MKNVILHVVMKMIRSYFSSTSKDPEDKKHVYEELENQKEHKEKIE
jgi:hypothetical protein